MGWQRRKGDRNLLLDPTGAPRPKSTTTMIRPSFAFRFIHLESSRAVEQPRHASQEASVQRVWRGRRSQCHLELLANPAEATSNDAGHVRWIQHCCFLVKSSSPSSSGQWVKLEYTTDRHCCSKGEGSSSDGCFEEQDGSWLDCCYIFDTSTCRFSVSCPYSTSSNSPASLELHRRCSRHRKDPQAGGRGKTQSSSSSSSRQCYSQYLFSFICYSSFSSPVHGIAPSAHERCSPHCQSWIHWSKRGLCKGQSRRSAGSRREGQSIPVTVY